MQPVRIQKLRLPSSRLARSSKLKSLCAPRTHSAAMVDTSYSPLWLRTHKQLPRSPYPVSSNGKLSPDCSFALFTTVFGQSILKESLVMTSGRPFSFFVHPWARQEVPIFAGQILRTQTYVWLHLCTLLLRGGKVLLATKFMGTISCLQSSRTSSSGGDEYLTNTIQVPSSTRTSLGRRYMATRSGTSRPWALIIY
jgi:hypothetical protein